MANNDDERRVIRARMIANQARTMIGKRWTEPATYDLKVREFVQMCVLSDLPEAQLSGKILLQMHYAWRKENGFSVT